MKRTTLAIAVLAGLNVALGGALFYAWHHEANEELRVERLNRVHLDVDGGGVLRVTLATISPTEQRSATTLIFTPRSAIQLHYEMGQLFALIEKSAAEASKGPRAEARSPDPTL